jgi:hypothetical protein
LNPARLSQIEERKPEEKEEEAEEKREAERGGAAVKRGLFR